MKKEQGFSLIELLIVVAIIAIIAAIAVPSMLQARMAANEAGAIQGCRTIGSAQMSFAAINNQTYAEALQDLVDRGFLDDRFDGAATHNGYTYTASTDTNLGTGLTFPDGFGYEGQPGANKGRYAYGIGPDQVVRYMGIGDNAVGVTDEMLCGEADCAAGDAIGINKSS